MLQDSSRLFRRFTAVVLGGFAAVTLSSCGGGGSGPGGTTPPPAGTTVTISGKITFDRVPFKAALNTGLNPGTPVESPARNVVVEAISGSGTTLAQTTTDGAGDYSVTVPAATNLFIRAKAQMVKTGAVPTFSFSVRNNTNSDALFALDGSTASSGSSNSTRNLRAASGWNGSSFVDAQRASAPFSILDTVYRAKELLVGALPQALPALDLYWSPSNRPTAGNFCTNTGDIGTTFYIGPGGTGDCGSQAAVVPSGIYVLGDSGGDSDEFDAHVIAHEFGHYVEDSVVARSDSMGGDHGLDDLLDLRLAFSEGWGDGFSAMVQADPLYRDSFSGIAADFSFNMESDNTPDPGWYSELSVAKVLWDVFDSGSEAGDTVALGFTPIFSAMTAQASTDALTSIFPLAATLRSANPGAASGISTLLNGESISGTDAFGDGESNDAGVANVLPVYDTVVLNTPKAICTSAPFGSVDGNKLGNNRLLRFVNDATRLVTIQATGAPQGGTTVGATDPDIYVYRRGTIVAFGDSTVANSETIAQFSLPAGTYVIELLDFDLTGSGGAARCMNLSIQG